MPVVFLRPFCTDHLTNKVSGLFLSCGRIGSLPGGTFAASALFPGSRKDSMVLGLFNKDSISRGDLCCLQAADKVQEQCLISGLVIEKDLEVFSGKYLPRMCEALGSVPSNTNTKDHWKIGSTGFFFLVWLLILIHLESQMLFINTQLLFKVAFYVLRLLKLKFLGHSQKTLHLM